MSGQGVKRGAGQLFLIFHYIFLQEWVPKTLQNSAVIEYRFLTKLFVTQVILTKILFTNILYDIICLR